MPARIRSFALSAGFLSQRWELVPFKAEQTGRPGCDTGGRCSIGCTVEQSQEARIRSSWCGAKSLMRMSVKAKQLASCLHLIGGGDLLGEFSSCLGAMIGIDLFKMIVAFFQADPKKVRVLTRSLHATMQRICMIEPSGVPVDREPTKPFVSDEYPVAWLAFVWAAFGHQFCGSKHGGAMGPPKVVAFCWFCFKHSIARCVKSRQSISVMGC